MFNQATSLSSLSTGKSAGPSGKSWELGNGDVVVAVESAAVVASGMSGATVLHKDLDMASMEAAVVIGT
jgi:hypothetical protein